MNADAPEQPPMGHLDMIEIGERKLTLQTEFLTRPHWRIETKAYLGGALKKIYEEDLTGKPEGELQRIVTEFHQARLAEITAGLQKKSSAAPDQNAE